jgi:hypothetical protein
MLGRATKEGTRRLRDRFRNDAAATSTTSTTATSTAATATAGIQMPKLPISSPIYNPLPYSIVPKSGLMLSAIGLGGYRLGSKSSAARLKMEKQQQEQQQEQQFDDSVSVVVKALSEAGINLIDTGAHFAGGK